MRVTKIIVLCFLTAAQLPAAQSPQGEEEPEVGLSQQTRLEEAVLLLDDAEASNRLAAVQVIVHQAGRGATMSSRLRLLLVRATADPAAEVAALAARALDRREHPPEPELASDDEIRSSADAGRLRWALETFSQSDPDDRFATDRLAAAHILVEQALSWKGEWGADLEWLVGEARRDDDSQIAYLAEKVLARHEARKMRPGFAWPATRSQEPTEARLEEPSRADAMYEGAGASDPEVRLSSLHWVVDLAISEGVDSDPRILDTLVARRSDPDPRVASFVRFALEGLSGDENSMREVAVDELE